MLLETIMLLTERPVSVQQLQSARKGSTRKWGVRTDQRKYTTNSDQSHCFCVHERADELIDDIAQRNLPRSLKIGNPRGNFLYLSIRPALPRHSPIGCRHHPIRHDPMPEEPSTPPQKYSNDADFAKLPNFAAKFPKYQR